MQRNPRPLIVSALAILVAIVFISASSSSGTEVASPDHLTSVRPVGERIVSPPTEDPHQYRFAAKLAQHDEADRAARWYRRATLIEAAEQQEAARVEAARQEAARQEAARQEAASRQERAPSPSTTQASPSPQMSGPYCGGDLPTCAIVQCESGGNPTARNPNSSASGLYQFIDSTWGGYGGYPTAADAPVHVQAERARQVWAGGAGRHHWVC